MANSRMLNYKIKDTEMANQGNLGETTK